MPGAEVLDTKDPQQLGRVRVRYYWPVAKQPQAETDWLRVLTPYSGAGKGQLFTPEKGSQVLVGYQQGLAEQPYVQGNLFHAKNPAGGKYSHGKEGGEMKGIQTMAGNRLTFHDKKGEEKIVITNGNKKETILEISFKGKGKIELKTKGEALVSATTIKLEGETIAMKGAKSISLDAPEITVAATTSAKISSKSSLEVSGLTTEVTGKVAMSLKSGTPMQINS